MIMDIVAYVSAITGVVLFGMGCSYKRKNADKLAVIGLALFTIGTII